MPSGPSRLLAACRLSSPNEHGAAAAIKIALLERERFTDPQPGAPEQDDQRAKPVSLGAVADRAHDGDDLLNGWWIGRVLLAIVARRAASVIARQRCRGRRGATRSLYVLIES